MEVKGFGKPEETRKFDKGKLELVKIGGAMVGRAEFQPGWKWSTSVKPLVKTNSCEAATLARDNSAAALSSCRESPTGHVLLDEDHAWSKRS